MKPLFTALSGALASTTERTFADNSTTIFTALIALAICIGASPDATAQTAVTYTQQTGNLSATFTDGTAGAFNNAGTEIGMYANSSGNKEVAVWRNLLTAGDGTGSARNLQVGDRFTITVSATSAFGGIGFSLNSGGTQGTSFANRVSGSRLFVQEVGTSASWEVNSASGTGGYTTLDYNVSTTRNDYTFEVYQTSQSTANVRLLVNDTDFGKRAYNLSLNGTAGANNDVSGSTHE